MRQASPDPLGTLGKVLIELMEVPSSNPSRDVDVFEPQRERIRKALSEYNLIYVKDGYITTIGATPVSQTLQDIIRARDLSGLQTEFDRIYENVESDPPSAVTASCALLESLFKTYIEEAILICPRSSPSNRSGRWFAKTLTSIQLL